ncbi:Uncharacterized protein TCM_040163 [Theobroma cacao]|uniref:Uncharacterized protein n=1 Tax=Theobroma cacao TaxID=3641 RepID=A0A061GT52_THECC|nr:Uncharacterized protein TCM_040163 [Theobroma cacao]
MERCCEVSLHDRNERKDKNTNTNKKERMSRRLIVEEERGDVNELADAFIKNFRNQLKIQREESFKCFQEMINRGV